MKYAEVFQLAKEKGYEIWDSQIFSMLKQKNAEVLWQSHILCELSLLQKWLRDEHKIFITIDFDSYLPDDPKYFADVRSLSSKNMGEELLSDFLYHNTYENSLLEGIRESLKLLNNDRNISKNK